MMTADPIAHLDFKPEALTCECKDCKHNPRHGCTDQATWCVRVHFFGSCHHPSVGPDGMVTQFVCGPCMFARQAKITEMFNGSRIAHARLGGHITCGGCGQQLDDINKFFEARSIV